MPSYWCSKKKVKVSDLSDLMMEENGDVTRCTPQSGNPNIEPVPLEMKNKDVLRYVNWLHLHILYSRKAQLHPYFFCDMWRSKSYSKCICILAVYSICTKNSRTKMGKNSRRSMVSLIVWLRSQCCFSYINMWPIVERLLCVFPPTFSTGVG